MTEVGNKVTKFKPGGLPDIGCMVDSCGTCENCMGGLEQYCAEDSVFTYGGVDRDGSENTHGGYSKSIVAHRDKVTGYFDFILDTFSATHDLGFYLRMLKTNG